MDQSRKLADLTLVSKYYPVANYSYPRRKSIYRNGLQSKTDRSSLESEGSAPGLVEDQSDSDVSIDDDHQYHTHATQLWDTFWRPKADKESRKEPEVDARKKKPALIPSPEQRRRRLTEGQSGRCISEWPLPDTMIQKSRNRQPPASYSPFPRIIALPPPGKPRVPSWQSSRARSGEPSQRSRRIEDTLFIPYIQQPSPDRVTFTSIEGSRSSTSEIQTFHHIAPVERPSTVMECHRPKHSLFIRPTTPAGPHRPKTSHPSHLSTRPVSLADLQCSTSTNSTRPLSLLEVKASKKLLAYRPPTPFEPSSPTCSPTTSYFPVSVPGLPSNPTSLHPGYHHRTYSRVTPESQSVFEDDSDSEGNMRSFFRLHKRSGSDVRRPSRTSGRGSESDAPRRRHPPTPGPIFTYNTKPGAEAPRRGRLWLHMRAAKYVNAIYFTHAARLH